MVLYNHREIQKSYIPYIFFKYHVVTTHYEREAKQMRRQQTKKHIVEPEKIGYKKQNNGSGYVIKKYTRLYNHYWGDYTVIVSNYPSLNAMYL